jgi:hypothetical protein
LKGEEIETGADPETAVEKQITDSKRHNKTPGDEGLVVLGTVDMGP